MKPPVLSRTAALFLDFDGCLVDLAPRPDAIVVPRALPALLGRLYRRQSGAVALISGRSVIDLNRYLPGFPGIIAGGHGAELMFPHGKIEAIASGMAETDIAELHRRARKCAGNHEGLFVETKPYGVVIHYRAAPDMAGRVTEAVERLAADFPMLAVQPGKMVVELRPKKVGKDRALSRLMTMPGFEGRQPIYAGDDLTDEAAMVRARRGGGFGIKIGSGKTCANYRLDNPQALIDWLSRSADH